jgi:hypothetical protein
VSVVSLTEVRARVDTELEDTDLQLVVDNVEAELAGDIGPLTGEREQTYWLDSGGVAELILQRRTDAVEVVDNDVAIADEDVRLLRRGVMIRRATGAWGGPIVTATYTPNDLAAVKRVIVELIRLDLADATVDSESIGSYRYSRATLTHAHIEESRHNLIRQLVPRRRQGTIRVRSATQLSLTVAPEVLQT